MLRIAQVQRKTGKAGRSAVYADIKAGTFVAPIKIAERCSAWPEHEVDAITAARIRGDSTEAIKTLVEQLHAARKSYGLPPADAPSKAPMKAARTGPGLAGRIDSPAAATA